MCDCISGIDIKNLNVQQADEEFKICATIFIYYGNELKKKGYDIQKEEELKSAMGKIMARLSQTCPELINVIGFIQCSAGDTIKSNIVDSADCKILRDAKFQMKDSIKHSVFVFSGNLQIENNLTSNYETRSEIIWVNDCEYILKLLSTTDPDMEKYFDYGTEMRVCVLEVNGDIVKCRMEMGNGNLFYIGEMEKIE